MASDRFQIRSAVYLFLVKSNDILLSRRYQTGWMDGHYSLISGHLDEDESVFRAVIREAKEEAGIIIVKKDLIPATVLHRKSTDQEYIDFFFVAQRWTGIPKIAEPNLCDDMRWFPANKLPENLLPYIKTAYANYINHTLFSSYGWE